MMLLKYVNCVCVCVCVPAVCVSVCICVSTYVIAWTYTFVHKELYTHTYMLYTELVQCAKHLYFKQLEHTEWFVHSYIICICMHVYMCVCVCVCV